MLHKIRLTSQILFLTLSFFLIIHGLIGPQFAPKNFTTLFIWVHYRGILVLTLLLAGNFFCMSCPMILLRNIGRKFISPRWTWPLKLQNKFPGILLMVAVLFCYEWLNLWGDPFGTSLLIISLFSIALITDLTFKKATFCKYLCPIGQFNFISSTLSPTVITKKNEKTCQSCETQDCLHGNKTKSGVGSLGCELDLFVLNKKGNMDCTLCMECVAACPHDNVILSSNPPALEILEDNWRSGIGKLSTRFDFISLIVVFTFGAILNALGMTSPAYQFQVWLADLTSIHREGFTLGILFLLSLVVIPTIVLSLCNTYCRSFFPRLTQKAYPSHYFTASLIPLGFSIWLSHYLFHFLTGALTFLPLLGVALNPQWMGVPVPFVTPIQMGIIMLGSLFSWWLLFQLFLNLKIERTLSLKKKFFLLLPWSLLIFILASVSVWIMTLPMEMRGTFLGG